MKDPLLFTWYDVLQRAVKQANIGRGRTLSQYRHSTLAEQFNLNNDLTKVTSTLHKKSYFDSSNANTRLKIGWILCSRQNVTIFSKQSMDSLVMPIIVSECLAQGKQVHTMLVTSNSMTNTIDKTPYAAHSKLLTIGSAPPVSRIVCAPWPLLTPITYFCQPQFLRQQTMNSAPSFLACSTRTFHQMRKY